MENEPSSREGAVFEASASQPTVAQQVERRLLRQRVQSLTRWLDTAVGIPGTRLTFGVDAVIGLFPVAGDLFSAAMSSYLIWSAAKVDAPTPMLTKMFGNVVADLLAGLIPVVGDVADLAFRANVRNLRLLEAWLDEEERKLDRQSLAKPASRKWLIGLAVVVVVVIFCLLGSLAAEWLNSAIISS